MTRRLLQIEPRVTFATVTWNCASELSALLESLENELSIPYEVVVVDNNSTDNVADVASRFPQCKFVGLEENRGFGGGNNIAVAAAVADVCILINPDTYLIDDSITRTVEVARTESAIFGPRILNVDRSVQPSASARPGEWLTTLGLLLPPLLFPRRARLRLEPWKYESRHPVGWLTGVCLVAQTDLLRKLGPFDDSIHMYSEDLELGLRAARQGIDSVFAPELGRLVHIGDASSGKRYSDAGKRLSVANRFAVVESLEGRTRAKVDFWSFTLGLALRIAAKKLVRRDAQNDSEWFEAAVAMRSSSARASVI